ncbi:MAG: ornithine carbamoyltransferase [Acidiferrobacterales bacterium]|nr:ornithine carbamoyltransferase [Acidiferrobacterales bacterium]
MTVRHYLSLMDLSAAELRQIINRAIEMKRQFAEGQRIDLFKSQTAVMVFEKSSTRTRVSFESGIRHLGGSAIFLAPNDSHLGRGEPLEDTARVLSRMSRMIIVRTGDHARLETLAEYASVPVVNALSDFNHPCQLLADLQTWFEHRGDITGKRVCWVGDGNNVCHSWMNAARLLNFDLIISSPSGYDPDPELLKACQSYVSIERNPLVGVKDADLVVTDTWLSMGREQEKVQRQKDFEGYCVDKTMMSRASVEALFMHCLPAYRGMEVAEDVIDGPQSVVWDEAENRMHAQKALMEFLLASLDTH